MQRIDRVSGYARAIAVRRRWRRVAEGLFDGFWLGVLTKEQLRRIDASFYSTTSEDVDGSSRTYGDPAHIRNGLRDWERAAAAHFPTGGRIIVTSAGAGREVWGLLELGFDACGYEPNQALVAAGHEVLADTSRLQVCDWDEFPTGTGPADAVIVGWGSYMLIGSRAQRIALLHSARDALVPGGMVLVSFFNRPATRYFKLVHQVGSSIRRLRRQAPLELGDALSPNFVHYFSSAEIAAELDEGGFEIVSRALKPYAHAVARRR